MQRPREAILFAIRALALQMSQSKILLHNYKRSKMQISKFTCVKSIT
jgi:hypothetical protein